MVRDSRREARLWPAHCPERDDSPCLRGLTASGGGVVTDDGLDAPVPLEVTTLTGRSLGRVACRRRDDGLVDETDAVRSPGDEVRCVSVGCSGRSSSRNALCRLCP